MIVRVLLFGPERAVLGRPWTDVTIPEDATPAALLAALGQAEPALRPLLGGGRIALNGAFAQEGQRIAKGDEVALIGLVSGG